MYTVLIVEDEPLVRMGLKNATDWAKHNMSVTADVANGRAALEAYAKEKPDIIITDIRMPVMDGMELIARIRKTDPKTLFVILTCLEEFSLVRQAMALGVTDYLLKLTATPEEIDALLEKLRRLLEDREAERRPGDATLLIAAREQLIKDTIFYRAFDADTFAAQAERLGMRLSQGGAALALMEVDAYHRLRSAFEDEKGYLTDFALMNVAGEVLGDGGEIVHDGGARYILLLHGSGRERTVETLRRLAEAIGRYFDISVSFGCGGLGMGYDGLHAMYRQAELALEGKYFLGPGHAHGLEDIDMRARMMEGLAPLAGLYARAGMDDARRQEAYARKARAMIEDMPVDKAVIREALGALLHWIVEDLALSADEAALTALTSHGQAIHSADSLEKAVRTVDCFLRDVRETAGRQAGHRAEIEKALRYIETNFRRDIALPDIAAHVGLSPNYFSTLLKKETGNSLTEHLNEVRIREAKRLLRGTHLKTYEVCEQAGFRDSAYFSALFKRVTGQSPNKYRAGWRRAAKEDAP